MTVSHMHCLLENTKNTTWTHLLKISDRKIERYIVMSRSWFSLYLLFVELTHKNLSFFLSLLVCYYTRECEFGNVDKIKNKKHKKTKQHKNFWLNFCLNKECPKLLCGLGICHRRRQTIPMWNSSGEKRILQGITVCLVSAILSTM